MEGLALDAGGDGMFGDTFATSTGKATKSSGRGIFGGKYRKAKIAGATFGGVAASGALAGIIYEGVHGSQQDKQAADDANNFSNSTNPPTTTQNEVDPDDTQSENETDTDDDTDPASENEKEIEDTDPDPEIYGDVAGGSEAPAGESSAEDSDTD
jgi:hypothetical protein